MWKNSQRYLEHCLYFDFPVCILLWLKKKNRGKDFSICPRSYNLWVSNKYIHLIQNALSFVMLTRNMWQYVSRSGNHELWLLCPKNYWMYESEVVNSQQRDITVKVMKFGMVKTENVLKYLTSFTCLLVISVWNKYIKSQFMCRHVSLWSVAFH
jgi:hypothetical protein